MADEDNSTPAASPKAEEEEASSAVAAAVANDAAATAIDETAAAISSITVEDASDEDDKEDEAVPPPPPQEQDKEAVPPPPPAAAHQFNFNLPPAAAAAAGPQLDFANLNAQFLSLLPPCIHPRLDKLTALSEERGKLLEQYLIERAALEQKYNDLMKPLYEKRRDVIAGKCDEEIQKLQSEAPSSSNEQQQQQQQQVKGIPQFWACAMGHIDILAELITEQDVDCLEHLTDITCNDFTDGSGFELHFHFSPNDFFTNEILTKRYEVPNLLTEDEPMLQSVTGTEIHWKTPDQCLTHKTITKKQRKKGGPNAGQVRTIQKTERAESFFHFFTPPKMPELGDVVDEEEADAMEEHFDHDYEVACAVRGSLIPNAVHWFTGEAMEDMMFGDEEDMLEEEGEEEEEDGNGGGFEFNLNVGGGGNGSSPFPPPAAGEGENPECKQN